MALCLRFCAEPCHSCSERIQFSLCLNIINSPSKIFLGGNVVAHCTEHTVINKNLLNSRLAGRQQCGWQSASTFPRQHTSSTAAETQEDQEEWKDEAAVTTLRAVRRT